MAELSTLGSVIKTAYEGQTNTNAYTDAEKSKLSGIDAGAQVNPPVATTGANGLMSSSDKTKLDGVTAGAQPNPGVATTSANGLMSSSDKTKLDGISSGANNYSLPDAGASVKGGVLMATAVADAADETEAVAQLNDLLAALRASGVLAV